jgi:hypothetical protein
MSITKLKSHWALPINNNTNAGRALAGRVIVGMLTGTEGPDEIITSAPKQDSKRR